MDLALDVTPTSALRWVLIWSVSTLAFVGLAERRLRQQVTGRLCATVFPVLLFALFIALPWGASKQFPQWWDRWWTYATPVSTLLLGLAAWLPLQGARLSWRGWWDFRYPLGTPDPEAAERVPDPGQLVVPRRTGLRLLGYLALLLGLIGSCIPMMIVSRPHAYPSWFAANGLLLGVTGLFLVGYGRKILILARTRRARDFPSLPVRDDAWLGTLLWGAAWVCCLSGLAVTMGAMTVMVRPSGHPWWAVSIAFPLMLSGGYVFTQGRKLFLRARRLRARIIPSPRLLAAGSYVLYLRSFEDDQRQTVMQQTHLPGSAGAVTGFVLSGNSAEEQIADVMRPVGPLIAVGAPGERLPHVGAVRMYLPTEPKGAWQEPVRQLMRRSRLTVLTLGASEGTMWELAQAFSLLPPQRLILFIPSMDKETYEHIRALLDPAPSTTRLPECPSWLASDNVEPVHGIIHFAADWTPTVTNVRKTAHDPRWNLFAALVPGLQPVFLGLEEYERETGLHCG